MGAIASIVVPDAATTPVNHTFSAQKVEGNTARYAEKSAATPNGFWHMTSTLRDPVNGTGAYRYTLELVVPTLKTYTDPSGNSQTVVDYVHRVKVDFLLAETGVLQNRKDIRKILVGVLNDAATIDQIESLNHIY